MSLLSRGLLESEPEPCELSAELVFAVPVSSMLGFLSLPLCWIFFMLSFHCKSFHWVGLLLWLASASWGPSQGCFSQVKSESWCQRCWGSLQFPWFCLATAKIWSDMNQSYSSVLELSLCCGCVISSVLSCHSKILKQQLTSVTSQCYSSVLFGKQRKIHPPGMKAGQHKRNKEKRSQRLNFGSSFYMFFSPPHEPALCKLG